MPSKPIKRRALEDLLGVPEGTLRGKANYAPGGKNKNQGRKRAPTAADFEGKTFKEIMAELPVRKARFVEETIAGKAGRMAVQAAGWACSDRSAQARAYNLTHADAGVMAAIDAARRELSQSAQYNIEAAFKEFGDAMAHAVKTDNSTAYVRAVEMRAKLLGMMVERQDVRQLSALSINIEGL